MKLILKFISSSVLDFFSTILNIILPQATGQDREWDAWKEENAKGSGNKMGKRY